MLAELLLKWPLVRQLKSGGDGTGVEAMSERTAALRPKHEDVQVARSVCPYCGVGCGQLAFHRDGKLVSIEGDPQSPISRGHLCPKGADSAVLRGLPAAAARPDRRPGAHASLHHRGAQGQDRRERPARLRPRQALLARPEQRRASS